MKKVSLKDISPVWILTTLQGEEFEKFKAEVDNQFSVFSETELNEYEGIENHKWWEVTQVDKRLSEKWEERTGLPKNIPLLNYQDWFDGSQVEVIFHSPLSYFEDNVKYIKGLRGNDRFMRNYINSGRLFYSVVSFKNEDCIKDCFVDSISAVEKMSDGLFESVVFHSDSSQCASNPSGYLCLGDDDFRALSVNLVFATALMKRTLNTVSDQSEKRFHTAGCFNFVYEPDAFKHNCSAKLAEQLMKSFCTNETEPEWFKQSEAKNIFEDSSLERNFHWRSVYNQMHTQFEEEKLDGIYTKPPISPWALIAYKLVPEYFKKYLKSLLRTVYEKIHDFGALTLMRYKSFTDNRLERLLKGTAELENSAQYGRGAVSAFLACLWSPNNKGAKGLKQAALLVSMMKDYFAKQRDEVERVKKWNQPNDNKYVTFPKANEYPLQEIYNERNKQFVSYYEEEATSHPLPSDNTPEINKNREHNELSDLHEVMQFHPMPLNLFVKAGLLAALLPISVWVILKMIPDTILKSDILESGTGLTIMYIAVAVIVILVAFGKYTVLTLRKIKNKIGKYVAWYYYQIERQTYLMTFDKVLEYYDEMINECDKVEAQLNAFGELETPTLPSFERYHLSKFQRNILGKLDNGSDVLKNDVVQTKLSINDKDYSLDEMDPDLFKAMIESCDCEMGDKILSMLLKDDNSMQDTKLELVKYWTSLLAKNISIHINGQNADTDITIPAYTVRPEDNSNFNLDALNTICATSYPSVFVPVARPYSWTMVFVSNKDGAGRKWESLFTGNDVMRRVPDYGQEEPKGAIEPEKTALFVRMHSFKTLIMKDGDTEKTIFNN